MKDKNITKHAKWIWHTRHSLNIVNSWMQARKIFSIDNLPEKAEICITADSRYRLFVNGIHVNRGPARGFQETWPYDTINIARYLKKGKNLIAVLAQCYGISTYSYIHKGVAGLLMTGEIFGKNISTNKSWKVRRAPGFSSTLTRVSIQYNFQEVFDGRKEDNSWLYAGYDDSGWGEPFIENFGAMPWHSFEKRGIPLLKEEKMVPVNVLSCSGGECVENYLSTDNIVSAYCSEEKQWQDCETPVIIKEDRLTLPVMASGEDRYRAFCIDFGKEVVGSVWLSIAGGDGGEIIDTVVCEAVDGLAPVVIHPKKTNCSQAFGNRLILRKDKTEHEQYDQWGFRYAAIIVRNSMVDLKISIRLNWTGYPLEKTASFTSSDKMLNDIYEMCAWTQQCCMLDAYMDCPWREQAQWWGDARIQAVNTFYLSADSRLFKRGIRQIGTQEVPNGLTFGHTPTIAYNCILPDFTLTWIITHWDYYYQTGDLSLFEEMEDRIHRAFDYFHNMTGNNGLIPYDERYWLFLDWCNIFKDGYPTLYNFFYLLALRYATVLFELTGKKESAEEYRKREQELYSSIMDRLWDKKDSSFYGGLSWDQTPVKQDSPHIYAFAVLLDLSPDCHRQFIDEYLLTFISGERAEEVVPSPCFIYYIFEALKKYGFNKEVISCIKRWWGDMIKKGLTTTEEVWDGTAGEDSLCHAWSAHPVVHFSNILLGILQKKPAWREICFSPEFENLDFADGKVATPHGAIEAGWRKEKGEIKVSINIPDGISANVNLPGVKKTIEAGNYSWSFKYNQPA